MSDVKPLHVAIIMDGNGRWASARHLPRTLGHKAGAEAVRRIVEAAPTLGITHLTLYSFSAENWGRPESEVTELMQLLRYYLKSEVAALHKNGIRLGFIGDRRSLPSDIITLMKDAESLTEKNKALTLTLALSYGGRQEIVRAACLLAQRIQAGEVSINAVDGRVFASCLDDPTLPDPDLVIRTSGEKRISNFLLWQSAYAEYVFTDVNWPDFTADDLMHALQDFKNRERRYGNRHGA